MAFTQHIRLLSAEVANKIAAGEVVDRPASVLKELIENAVDAAATQIDVEIDFGGRKLIAVHDNGTGMGRDDALLSVERHATSKIRDVNDIERIATLGFRGEALAAISSVSRFRLRTATSESPAGTELWISGGKLQDVRDAGGPVGTSVEVRDLFFNVPARRKFLRSAETEIAHLRQTFIVQALARPQIGMTFKADGRPVYALAAGDRLENRLRDLFGSSLRDAMRPVDFHSEDLSVTGFAALPAQSRADRSEEYVFVNGRPAGAPVLGHAIREGYHKLLPNDRHPVVFLFIGLDPEGVDVNVHPTKKEVRFRRTDQVRDAVIQALRQALTSEGSLLASGPVHPLPGSPDEAPPPLEEPLIKIEDLPRMHSFRYPRMPMIPSSETDHPSPPPAAANDSSAPAPQAAGLVGPTPPVVPAAHSPWAWCRVVGQIGDLYVVLETEDGFVIMDPHAAHERVLFERFMAAVSAGRVETQGLLVPESVELMPREALQLRKNLDLFRQMGFGIADFGGDTFVVDALPACFTAVSVRGFLVDLAQRFENAGSRNSSAGWREEMVAQAACKAAVKARDTLALAEIEKLVNDLAATTMPYTCPHGRPTLIYTSFGELNRKFGREG